MTAAVRAIVEHWRLRRRIVEMTALCSRAADDMMAYPDDTLPVLAARDAAASLAGMHHAEADLIEQSRIVRLLSRRSPDVLRERAKRYDRESARCDIDAAIQDVINAKGAPT